MFSGDYCEHSGIYTCDRLRAKKAELAILDCAYGSERVGAIESKENLYRDIKYWLMKRKNVLLPVPKYGRGMEILKDLLQFEEVGLVVEECLFGQCNHHDKFQQEEISKIIKFKGNLIEGHNVYLICDSQLKKIANRRFASKMIVRKDKIILTGNIEEESYCEMIYKAGAALKISYYVHQNLQQAKVLISKNAFDKVVLSHSRERFEKKDIGDWLIPLSTGEKIVF